MLHTGAVISISEMRQHNAWVRQYLRMSAFPTIRKHVGNLDSDDAHQYTRIPNLSSSGTKLSVTHSHV